MHKELLNSLNAEAMTLEQLCTILRTVDEQQDLQFVEVLVQVVEKFKLLSRSKVLDFSDHAFQALLTEFDELTDKITDKVSETSIGLASEPVLVLGAMLSERDSILEARKIFDREIVRLTNIPKLFKEAGPGNFEVPFISVLTYAPQYVQACLKNIALETRLELAKQGLILMPFYQANVTAGILNTHLQRICMLLECFAPLERVMLVDGDLGLSIFDHIEEYSIDFEREEMIFAVQRFKRFLDEAAVYYKPGLNVLFASMPSSLQRAILGITTDLDQYLSILQAMIGDRNPDVLQVAQLVVCLRSPLNTRQFDSLVKVAYQVMRSSYASYNQMMNAIMADPIAYAQLSKHDLVQIQANGVVISRLVKLAKKGFATNVLVGGNLNCDQNLIKTATVPAVSAFAKLTDGWIFVKSLHRTLLFVSATDPTKMRAIKIRKDNEHFNALAKERHMLELLRAKQKNYNLRSTLPIPVGVFLINDLDQNLKPAVISEVTDSQYYCCYVYDAAPAQFKYLVDSSLSESEFNQGLKVAMYDLITLLLKDKLVMHPLIDLFHNDDTEREDRGIYDPIIEFSSLTQGKLMAWMSGCQYPNLRQAGLADFGDCIIVSDVKQFYSYLACYLLSFELIICYRARQRYDAATTADHKQEIWQQAVRTIIGVYELALAELKLNVLGVAVEHIVDAQRLASQLQYWLTVEYVEDFENGRFKRWIYDDVAILTCTGSDTSPNEHDLPTWNSLVGFTSFRNPTPLQQDIGPFAGPFPVTELTKLRVGTMFFISNNLGQSQQWDAICKHDFNIALASSRLKL